MASYTGSIRWIFGLELIVVEFLMMHIKEYHCQVICSCWGCDSNNAHQNTKFSQRSRTCILAFMQNYMVRVMQLNTCLIPVWMHPILAPKSDGIQSISCYNRVTIANLCSIPFVSKHKSHQNKPWGQNAMCRKHECKVILLETYTNNRSCSRAKAEGCAVDHLQL